MLEAYNKWVSQKNWNHLKFLRYLLLIMVLVLLMLVSWIFILTINEILSPSYLEKSLTDLGTGFLMGAITGLVQGFLILFPKYRDKNWDLHQVVPNFLFYHLFLSVLYLGITIFIDYHPILESGFILGIIIGGMLTIIAYAGEVEREHQDDLELIEGE